MMSVRSVVEPYNRALSGAPTIFLNGSFVGLPLINQALFAENPLSDRTFFVTVRSLIKVLGLIPPADVINALNVIKNPPVPNGGGGGGAGHPGGGGGGPVVASPTCAAELDLDQPGFGGITGMRIFGGGFVPNERIEIFEKGFVIASTNAVDFGFCKVHVGFADSTPPVLHTVHARGLSSGRTSGEAGFML